MYKKITLIQTTIVLLAIWGVDSAWTLVEVKEYGLNPLAVHMDNGWNTELAQNNIENLAKF